MLVPRIAQSLPEARTHLLAFGTLQASDAICSLRTEKVRVWVSVLHQPTEPRAHPGTPLAHFPGLLETSLPSLRLGTSTDLP